MRLLAWLCLQHAVALAALKSATGATPVNVLQCPGGQDCLVPDCTLDSSAVLHCVWGTSEKQALYAHSSDKGRTWSAPVTLNDARNVTTTMGERGPKLAASVDGLKLWVAWPDLWYPGAVTYARVAASVDGGKSWSAPAQASSEPAVDGLSIAADASAGPSGTVIVVYHVANGTAPVNASSATWLRQALSTDGGLSFQPSTPVVIGGGAVPPVACSMCATQLLSAGAGTGAFLIAFRSAIDNIRDFYLLNGTAASAAYAGTRVPVAQPWYVTSCPMNGPAISLGPAATGRRVLYAFMTGDANLVYWAALDPSSGAFSAPVGTPAAEGNERYATAVTNAAGDVLMVWNVGPMAVSGTSRVKYALWGLDGTLRAPATTIGASFAGTKATAWVGADDEFYVMTTAQ